MAFNPDEFRAEMQYDGARPNKFQVDLTLPSSGIANLAGGATNVSRKFSFMCRTSQIPDRNIGTTIANYFGREVKLAGDTTYSEWMCTVYNDEDFVVRNALEKWMNAMNQNRSNLRVPQAVNSSLYTADPILSQYGKTGDVIKRYKLVGGFPINLSIIDLDWGTNDVVEEFTVTFQYQYWIDPDNTDITT